MGERRVSFVLGDAARDAASLDHPESPLRRAEHLGRFSKNAARYRAPTSVAEGVLLILETCPAFHGREKPARLAVRNAATSLRRALGRLP